MVETVRVEVGRAVDDRPNVVRGGSEGSGDDLRRFAITPEGVHGDADAHELRSGRSERLHVAPTVRLARRAGVM